MTALIPIYTGLYNTALLFSAFMAVWSFWLWFRREELNSNFWGALVINAILLIVQLVLGGLLYLNGIAAERWVHYLYDIMMAITIPAIFGYTRGRSTYQEGLVYAVALFFVWGLVLRAVITGGGLLPPA